MSKMKWRTRANAKKMRRQGTRPAKDQSSRSAKNYKVVSRDGEPCPRCGVATQVRERIRLTEKQLRQPYYYSAYYLCANRKCKTTFIMPEKFKVENASATDRQPHDDGGESPEQVVRRIMAEDDGSPPWDP